MKYKREPQHDKRIERGDEFSGNAWRDTETNEIRYVAVGVDPNMSRLDTTQDDN